VGTLPAECASQLATARERWPGAPEPDAAFAKYAAARWNATPRVEDLYLAWWCSSGDAAAIAAFESRYDGELRAVTSRFRELPADELRQQLRIKLFVGTPDVKPKIIEYTGKGALGAWLRVTAVRSFVDVARSTRRDRYAQELDEVELLGVASPERGAISSELGAAVKQAFADAVARLSTRERVFLRHAYVDRHTLEQIASHYAVHRATVARTLASAREQLIANTRAAVAQRAGVSEDDLATLIRALDSRIELSLSRILAP
jgi:RNA polymerase sigma-70 factor (ECF subfamily)